MKKLWSHPAVAFVRKVIWQYMDCRGPQAAACFAYFVLLTVFPLLLCVSACLGQFHIDIAELITHLETMFPAEALAVLRGYLTFISVRHSAAFFVAGLVGCWFSAAAAFRTIARVIMDVYPHVSQSILRGLVTSILFPIALLLTIDLSVIVVVTGQKTLHLVADHLPAVVKSHLPALMDTIDVWSWIRFVLLFAVFFLFILAVFNMAAPKGTPRFPMLLSSFVSSLAMVVASGIFSFVIGLSSRYSLVYGSLVSLIILMLWLYLCGQILFFGVVLTGVWYRGRRD